MNQRALEQKMDPITGQYLLFNPRRLNAASSFAKTAPTFPFTPLPARSLCVSRHCVGGILWHRFRSTQIDAPAALMVECVQVKHMDASTFMLFIHTMTRLWRAPSLGCRTEHWSFTLLRSVTTKNNTLSLLSPFPSGVPSRNRGSLNKREPVPRRLELLTSYSM